MKNTLKLNEIISEINQKDIERFITKIPVTDNDSICWEWSINPNTKKARKHADYGVFTLKQNNIVPSRMMWMLTYGEIPDGMLICHKCDNPPCINPFHLFIGSYADNTKDMVMKGRKSTIVYPDRLPRGINHKNAKLNDVDILQIRTMSSKGVSYKDIKAQFNIGKSNISSIINRKTWTHL